MAFIIGIAEVILGILCNLFIGGISQVLFRQDNRTTRIILRIAGIFLLINGISRAFNV